MRDVLGDMELGLWMTPMHFHPSSNAYREHPEWACTPTGDGLAVERFSTGYVAAAGLASHITFFDDLTGYSDAEIETAAAWSDLYHRERDRLATFTYPLLDDPLGGDTWTALQPWDPETGRGSLLVFRQDHPDATRTVALRGVRGGGAYRLTDAVTGAKLGVFSANRLRRGIELTLPDRHSARVLLIEPVGRRSVPGRGA